MLASLNHTGIAHVYGFESATLPDGTTAHFLAMELAPGEDLSERLTRGPIPVGEALEIAKQIAEALEEAHEKGIVHRDLKPANVKLTPDGKVKVLDFGLARAWAGDDAGSVSGSGALSESPTLAHTGTAAGLILGTAAYMSPEQARGKVVDKRADVWAFGVVLFEMLTGRRLFDGETVSDVLASVLKSEPDWPSLPKAAPASLRRLLERCLQRDPRRRLRDIGDARLVLEDSLAGRGDEPPAAAPPARGAKNRAVRRPRRAPVAEGVVGEAAVLPAVHRATSRLSRTPDEVKATHWPSGDTAWSRKSVPAADARGRGPMPNDFGAALVEKHVVTRGSLSWPWTGGGPVVSRWAGPSSTSDSSTTSRAPSCSRAGTPPRWSTWGDSRSTPRSSRSSPPRPRTSTRCCRCRATVPRSGSPRPTRPARPPWATSNS